ncbi:MAG: hypothetical protein QOJ13_3014 [Gaiellales bacterium]|jgi:hypothetical protein|nr:hypothetical protein [Gaiellales bacterium]
MRTVLWLVCLIAAGCGSAARTHTANTPSASQPAAAEWNVEVTVGSLSAGPITVAAAGLRPAAAGVDSRPWMQHELVFRNTGDTPVTFADTRTSRFLGQLPRLLAGDEGCGYEKRTARVIPGTCESYLDAFTVQPHTTVRRTVTLFKELPGMQQLVPGTYVFGRQIRFAMGSVAPDEGDGRAVTLNVRYAVSLG